MSRPRIDIISPALAEANNGNWHTAARWAAHLRPRYAVRILSSSDPDLARSMPAAAIALHARRSAEALRLLRAAHPALPLVLVLTGTDVYRDIRTDATARRSLALADRIVVLQAAALAELDPDARAKAVVIHQSAPAQKPAPRPVRPRPFRVTMIGHLREEKDPRCFMEAAALVDGARFRFVQVGAALDPALGAAAEATQRHLAHYAWRGALPHAETRRLLRHSDLLAIPSRMEGGANVIIEAVTSGVPVVASDISGNRGMLGPDHPGYFPVGDAAALARLVERCAGDPAFDAALRAACAARAPLFAPATERAALRDLVDNLVISRPA